MNFLEVFILGVVQGISEFLPISSSAHLIIFRDLFGIGQSISPSVRTSFDLALHFGTLLAVIVFFFKDLINILKDGFTKPKKEGRIFWYIIIATIPAGIIGFLFDDIVENFFRKNLIVIAISLIFMGLVLYFVDSRKKEKKEIKEMTLKDAIIIGIFQSFALIPGFSRSGTTISTGRYLEFKREDATKFSFFLSIPVIAGAFFLKVLKHGKEILNTGIGIFLFGIFISFIVGILSIKYLLKYLKKNDFKIFMYYRLILGIIIIISLIFR